MEKRKTHISLVDCGSQKVPHIIAMLENENCLIEVICLEEISPVSVFDSDGIVISGAPILLTETGFKKFQPAVERIVSQQKPVLGICFGHQCIGLYFGAKVNRGKEDRDWTTIEKKAASPLLNELKNTFSMTEDHCEEITLPENFQLIASSENCMNEAMQQKEKNIFGVQFHPETSGENGRIIFSNFIRICQNVN